MTKHISWRGVLGWMLLTFLGLLFAGGLHFPGDYGTIFWSAVEYHWGSGVLGFVFGAISGLFIAGAQAIMFRHWRVPFGPWLAYTALAYGVIHAIADAVPYRPFTSLGGGVILAVCQYLALRRRLTKPLLWLPLTAIAWWLAFGLGAGPQDYNPFLVIAALAGASGVGLRLLMPILNQPAPPSIWSRLNRLQRVVLVIVAALFLVFFAIGTGLMPGL